MSPGQGEEPEPGGGRKGRSLAAESTLPCGGASEELET